MDKKTILVVDDEPSILTAVKDTLEEKYTVITANNGREALQMIDSHNPDLVIMDIMMPELDGMLAVKELHKTHKPDAPPVIFLSAKAQISDIEQGYQFGGFDYITKPFSPANLLKKVDEVIERMEIRKKIQQKKKI